MPYVNITITAELNVMVTITCLLYIVAFTALLASFIIVTKIKRVAQSDVMPHIQNFMQTEVTCDAS